MSIEAAVRSTASARTLAVVFALVALALVAFALTSRGGGEGTITPEETLRRMKAGDTSLVILDVRTPQEFTGSTGHLEGAVLLPIQELAQRMGELEGARGRTVVVYCRTVNRSGQAASLLRENGFTVFQMTGGITEWNALGYPVAREEQQ
jgi:rhodanese-related sulfurtransferase